MSKDIYNIINEIAETLELSKTFKFANDFFVRDKGDCFPPYIDHSLDSFIGVYTEEELTNEDIKNSIKVDIIFLIVNFEIQCCVKIYYDILYETTDDNKIVLYFRHQELYNDDICKSLKMGTQATKEEDELATELRGYVRNYLKYEWSMDFPEKRGVVVRVKSNIIHACAYRNSFSKNEMNKISRSIAGILALEKNKLQDGMYINYDLYISGVEDQMTEVNLIILIYEMEEKANDQRDL
jgi:hypothetical protein